MEKLAILDLIVNSSKLLALVNVNGDIIFLSKNFENFIADKLPYNSNILSMLNDLLNLPTSVKTMISKGEINTSELNDVVLTFRNNVFVDFKFEYNINFDNENALVLSFDVKNNGINVLVNNIINSKSLFINLSYPLLIFNLKLNQVVTVNKKGCEFFGECNVSLLPKEFIAEVRKSVLMFNVGGVALNKKVLNVNGFDYDLLFEVGVIDENSEYFHVRFNDVTLATKKDNLIIEEQKRVKKLVDVVPGVLFEFEVVNANLNFKYISNSVKELTGVSSDLITQNSQLIFDRFEKLDRARLHYLFANSNSKYKNVKNEFRIKDIDGNVKWVTIDWKQNNADENIVSGAGYVNEITRKKNTLATNVEANKLKYLKEYFMLLMLKHDDVNVVLSNVVKSLVTKINVPDSVIYMYNIENNDFESVSWYSNTSFNVQQSKYPQYLKGDVPIVSRAIKTHQLQHENINRDFNNNTQYCQNNGSVIVMPIAFEGDLLGLIVTTSSNSNFFNDFHFSLFNSISDSLGKRFIKDKMINDSALYTSAITSLSQKGKIFNWNFDLVKSQVSFNNIYNIFTFFGVKNKADKIEILEDNNKVFENVFTLDLTMIHQELYNISKGLRYKNEIEFRFNNYDNVTKWGRVSFNQVVSEKGTAVKVDGTIKDITKYKKLEFRNKGLETLLSAIMNAQLEFEKGANLVKVIGIVSTALGVDFSSGYGFEHYKISLAKSNKINNTNANELFRPDYKITDEVKWMLKEGTTNSSDLYMLNYLLSGNSDSLSMVSKYYDSDDIKYIYPNCTVVNGSESFLVLPLKTPTGLFGMISFVDNDKDRKWLDYEKKLLSGFANFLALKTESNILLENVKSSNLKMRNESEQKSLYINTMSHEIRTPLNGIIGSIDLLKTKLLTDEQYEWVRAISASSDLLLSTVNKILNHAKIERGHTKLIESELEICNLIDSVKRSMMYHTFNKDVDIICNVGPLVPDFFIADEVYLRQILNNLVSNAIKFIDNGEVRINIDLNKEYKNDNKLKLDFSVEDEGPGIPHEKLDSIFDSFEQLQNANNTMGSGLGLSITKRLITVMGGSIVAKNIEGKGSVFEFSIEVMKSDKIRPETLNNISLLVVLEPEYMEIIKRVCARYKINATFVFDMLEYEEETSKKTFDILITDDGNNKLSNEFLQNNKNSKVIVYTSNASIGKIDRIKFMPKPILVKDLLDELFLNDNLGVVNNSVTNNSNTVLLGKSILLADDDAINRLLAKKMLEFLGATDVDMVENGEEAIDKTMVKKYDLIFMDFRMPIMDGITATKKIKDLFGYNTPPIIALTAEAFEKDELLSIEVGMDDYLRKPININTLKEAVNRVLGKKQVLELEAIE